MLKVGLTGSIAVGKSFVCEILRGLGCRVLDADITARKVVEPGTSGFDEIVETFGPEMVSADGRLDRKRLGSIVFADPEKLHKLNAIVHPRVINAQNEWLNSVEAEDPDAIAVVDASLMIESGSYERFTKLIVVWCKPAIQLQRLMLRENIDRAAAEKRIAAQLSQEQKKAYADFLIDTSGDFADAEQQTIEVFHKLQQAAGRKT